MAYLRFSRDRRGYEQFALLQPSSRRGSKARPRLLYWFRSPPNVKVGREPFDADVRRTLEARHPDVPFDWPAIISTPIPPVENESWRERRRAERAARQSVDAPDASEAPSVPEPGVALPPLVEDVLLPVAGDAEPTVDVPNAVEPVMASEPTVEPALPADGEEHLPAASVETAALVTTSSAPSLGRRRRRRRRRRGGQPRDQVHAAPAAEPPIHELGTVSSEASGLDTQGEEPESGEPDEEV
jgi:hypothetical protein